MLKAINKPKVSHLMCAEERDLEDVIGSLHKVRTYTHTI